MDSKTAAELRRQKILANAESRLKRIKRVTLEEVEKEGGEQICETSTASLKDFKEGESKTDSIAVPGILTDFKEEESKIDDVAVPEILNDFKEEESKKDDAAVPEMLTECQIDKCINKAKTLTNGGLCNGSLDKSDNEQTVTHLSHKYFDESNSGLNLEAMQNLSRKSTLSQIKRQVCLDLVIFIVLGISIRLLYSIGLSSIILNNILGPFLMVCLPRVLFYIKEKPEVPLMYSIILVLGVKESRIKLPFRVLSCLRTIVQYFAVYLFSFFVTHCILKELPL